MSNEKKQYWALSAEQTIETLKTSKNGLETKEVEARLRIFKSNEIDQIGHDGKIAILARQFKSLLIIILLIAGMLTVFVGEWIESAVIFAAVAVNTVLGYWQENKAENVLALLRSYIRTRTRVVRGGKEREIDSSEIVPGDILRINQGDRIPADARLLFTNNFEVDESILTGESLPVVKNTISAAPETSLTSRTQMIFSGTLALQGTAEAVVTETGNRTEFGSIATLVASRERVMTPLQEALHKFSIKFGIILAFFSAALFVVGVIFHYEIYEMFLVSVAVAVAAVPEGLPIALTVILAVGVQRLASNKGIIRKLVAAETMGSVTVILTDKTGTLTEAKMELTDVVPINGSVYSADDILRFALVNNGALVENPDENHENWTVIGRPMEVSMIREAAKRGIFLPNVLQTTKVVYRLPFDSSRKFSASLIDDDPPLIVLLGAPEVILEACPLRNEIREAIAVEIESRAVSGQRVLGLATGRIPQNEDFDLRHKMPETLNFDGLLAFHDPVRKSVPDAVKNIAKAGIRTIIVTGDHRGTAEAVANEIGIELSNVYARVTPKQKLQIVESFQKDGEIVAVTGDGVNDAPALKKANIGVAVGSGTDVAKSVADLIILDDNFETIVRAIEEGRRILDNIRKTIVYLFSNVFDGLFLIGGSLLLGMSLPLNALQILFVNFFVDSFPAVAFAMERGIDGSGNMPRRVSRDFFDAKMRFIVLIIGSLTSFMLFALYVLLIKLGFAESLVRTYIFGAFATYTLLLAFAVRSLDRSIISYNPFSNLFLTGGVLLGIAATLAVIYVPALQIIFGTVPLPTKWLIGVFGIGIVNITAIEITKKFLKFK